MVDNDKQDKVSSDKNPSEKRRSGLNSWLSDVLPKREPAFLGLIIRIGDPVIKRIEPFIQNEFVIADLGCGWGYYSFAMAKMVGSNGKIYAVDIDPKVTKAIGKKVKVGGYPSIEVHTASAADLSFINSKSIDFILANGLLCSMPVDRPVAVFEMKRILKPTGKAYISLGGTPPWGYVDENEWKLILQGFQVEQGGSFKEKYAVVSLK